MIMLFIKNLKELRLYMINEKLYDWLFIDFWRYVILFVFGLFGVR